MRIIVHKANSLKFLLWFSFVVSIIVETFVTMKAIPDNQMVKAIQYILLLIPVGLSLLKMIAGRRGLSKKPFWKELKSGFIIVLAFLVLSIHRSYIAGKFSFESIMQLCQIIVPFLFAYIMVNELSELEITYFMKTALWMTIIGYIVVTAVDFGPVSNIFRISIVRSYSPFENSVFAEIASGLGAYFIYYRRKLPRYATAAVILNFLIFKRVLMLMTIVLLVISLRNKQDEKVSKKLVWIACVGWIVLIFSIYSLWQPETVRFIKEHFDFDITSFTMARVYRLWYVLENHFVSYGLGSTTQYIATHGSYLGAEFEMDFIRILFELGPIAIVVFVYEYLSTTNRNRYAFWLVNLCFLNLLMANGLLKYWGYTARIITIALINYGVNQREGSDVVFDRSS